MLASKYRSLSVTFLLLAAAGGAIAAAAWTAKPRKEDHFRFADRTGRIPGGRGTVLRSRN